MTMFYGTPDRFASYASIPQYISSDIRSLFLENSEYMSFDMTEPDRVTIRLESDRMRGKLSSFSQLLRLLTHFRSYFGRQDHAGHLDRIYFLYRPDVTSTRMGVGRFDCQYQRR